MECPRDHSILEEVEIDGVRVDICKSCGGIWFDNFEIKKFDEVHEDKGDQVIALTKKYKKPDVNLEGKINCPKCKNVVMMRRFHSPARAIEVDECAACAGIWLDAGELAALRDMYPTEEDRKKAGEAFVSDTLAPAFKAMRAESREGEAKARRFANMFRFICPTNYIPGKQDWGAF